MEKGGSWLGHPHPDGAVLSPDWCLGERGSAETSMWLTSWRWVPGWNFPGKLARHPHPIRIAEAKNVSLDCTDSGAGDHTFHWIL